MFGLGFGEILLIFIIVMFFFGGKKLPQLGSSLGESIRNFKKALNDESDKNNKDGKN